jgi:hypothetical protein
MNNQLSIFPSNPPAPIATATERPAMWVSSYHVCKGPNRKLYYFRFYWQDNGRTRHEHIPGGSVSSIRVQNRKVEVEAMIDRGETPETICKVIRSWSEGRGSNLNRRKFVG